MSKYEHQEQEFSFKNYFIPFTTIKAIHFIVIIGLIVFFNSLFNGFIGDDIDQIINNPSVHSLSNIPTLFLGSSFYEGGEIMGIYYKPLLTIFYTILYGSFGANAFIFHFTQLVLYIGNAVLVFLLLLSFFSKRTAFFLSVVFLIHPINAETVDYIADLQDILFFFFGMVSFLLLKRKKLTYSTIILAYFSLLLSLFSKETGILFLLVLLLYMYLYKREFIYKHILYSSIILAIYSFFRFIVAKIYFSHELASPIASLPLNQRVLNIPSIMIYYLKTFIYPVNLIFEQVWFIKKITFINFYLPLFIELVFILSILAFIFYLYRHKNRDKKAILFFFGWFIVGLCSVLQIFPLDATVDDRWFYFPIVGLLGMSTVIYKQIHIPKRVENILLPCIVVIVLLFSLRTIIRNTNWKDNMTLYSNDILLEPSNFIIANSLGTELINQHQYNNALPYIQRSVQINPQWTLNWNNLGVIYSQTGERQKAKTAIMNAINHGALPLSYENMAILLLNDKNKNKAQQFLTNAVKKFPYDDKLWINLALADERLHKHNKAIIAAQNAYSLNPNSLYASIINRLLKNQPLFN